MSNLNGRIYTQKVFLKALNELKDKYTQLYCQDCLYAWEKGKTNLNSLDDCCTNCVSYYAPGVTKEIMRELKLKRLMDEK